MGEKPWDNDWLVFSRKTRRGAFVLLVLFFLIAVLPRIYRNYFIDNNVEISYHERIEEQEAQKEQKKKEDKSKPKSRYNIPDKKFNPNEFGLNDWKKIGLSEKQATSVLKFKEQLGGFKTKEDVKKSYVISDKLFNQIKDKIDIPQIDSDKEKSEKDTLTKTATPVEVDNKDYVVEINSATAEELVNIKGIGDFFAKKIIEQREKLGGFLYHEQLLVIYNFDEEKLSEVRPFINIDESKIEKLNINFVSVYELKNHPYIEWNVAKSIVDLRDELGRIKSIDQLLLSPYIDRNLFKKIRPYIRLE